LQVVQEQQSAADPRPHRLGEQRGIVPGQPDPDRPGQRERRLGGQAGEATAGEHRTSERGAEPGQRGAASTTGPAVQHHQAGRAEQRGAGLDDIAARRRRRAGEACRVVAADARKIVGPELIGQVADRRVPHWSSPSGLAATAA
jgi:hypothetical protein